ncbi:hypothetical protein GPJ56_003684 [Histomonas meleagridis]|uniref:uncharacterized protein n=1 Tax=Histomonas meleagridis TaxID=135588 RepID=UPI00355999B4|nr:hypothetical protein GPJ56_003684 [Histomonas meleagridis]KAH0806231.1 hypothetical protein GO595_000919 [Histomonas meleagridis]
MKPSLFSFLGDSLALVNNNNLFLLKITNEPQEYDTTPYIPGSECYELEENQLTIDFGVSQENKNFSFLERHLPNHIVSVTTVFRLHLPGEPISIQFISSQTLILVTNNAILSCKRSTNKNGKEIYDPLMIQTSDGVTDILYNENFLILYNKDQIRYIPNPDKSSLDYSYGQLLACDDIKMMNIKFVCANNNYCVIITTSDEGPGVYILKFEKIDVLIKAAIKSSSIDTKMIGLFLMNQSNPLFAENAYKIAMEKLKSKNKKKINEPAEAASLLSYAFNTGKLSQRKRKKALNEINHLNPKIKRNFIEKTNLKKEEITTEMLSEILLIQPSDVAVMKLIQTRQLKCSVNLPESSILDLYKAIRASVENEHENAKLLFLNIPDSTLTLIDDELLTMISKDLTSSTLVRIGKPEFANNEWDINERKASYFFLHERVQEALEIAGKFLDANWHFSDWPKVPKFCGWIEGSEMVKFVAQCITEYSVLENDVPGSIKNIVKGINFAKTKRYKEALETFGDTIFPLRFLRQFAKTSEDWVKVMQQVEENDIKEAAFHFLIANSPRADYYSAVENCSELSAYSSVFRQLKEADEKLIVLIGASLT